MRAELYMYWQVMSISAPGNLGGFFKMSLLGWVEAAVSSRAFFHNKFTFFI